MGGLTVVLPAYNEATVLPATLAAVWAQQPDDVIVVADSCTDPTVALARQSGARVVEVATRNVALNRNLGALVALGDCLVFLDADSPPPPGYLAAVRAAVAAGGRYGGCELAPPAGAAWIGRWRIAAMNACSRWLGLYYGTNTWVTRGAFEAVGGYDEQIGWGEDLDLTLRLRLRGRASHQARARAIYSDRKFIRTGYLRETLSRLWLGGGYLLRLSWRTCSGRRLAST
ncbi:MAG: glycosyltransferase [Fimbriimonadaceae bacterium]|nr:glycosyltransferase [Fimbriimonadaceae bacterium]